MISIGDSSRRKKIALLHPIWEVDRLPNNQLPIQNTTHAIFTFQACLPRHPAQAGFTWPLHLKIHIFNVQQLF
jgi:hypothetical protein